MQLCLLHTTQYNVSEYTEYNIKLTIQIKVQNSTFIHKIQCSNTSVNTGFYQLLNQNSPTSIITSIKLLNYHLTML